MGIDAGRYGARVTTPETPDDTPPTPPGNPYGPPPIHWQPAKKGFWQSTPGVLVAVAGVLLLLCCGLGRIGRGSGSDDAGRSDMRVDITSCSLDGDTARVGLEVTNNGDVTESARIEIEYRDSAGRRVDTDTTWVRDIAPGDTVRTEESTLLDAPTSSGRCIVTEVR